MTDFEQRRGMRWLAIAAAAIALLLVLNPPERTGSHRASASLILPPASAQASIAARLTAWEWSTMTRGAGADRATWSAMLPVLFVGLLAPLALEQARLLSADARTHAAPVLPSAFQRPPPQLA